MEKFEKSLPESKERQLERIDFVDDETGESKTEWYNTQSDKKNLVKVEERYADGSKRHDIEFDPTSGHRIKMRIYQHDDKNGLVREGVFDPQTGELLTWVSFENGKIKHHTSADAHPSFIKRYLQTTWEHDSDEKKAA